MSDGVLLTERECIDLALHFANGELEKICDLFVLAYSRDKPEIANALAQRGTDERVAAMARVEIALNAFLGTGGNIKLKDCVNG